MCSPRPARTPPLQQRSPRSRWRRLARAQELCPFDTGCQAGLLPSCADSNSAHALTRWSASAQHVLRVWVLRDRMCTAGTCLLWLLFCQRQHCSQTRIQAATGSLQRTAQGHVAESHQAQSALIKRCLHDSLRDLLRGARAGHATAFIQELRWACQGSQLLSTSPDPCTGSAQAWGEQLTADEALGIS